MPQSSLIVRLLVFTDFATERATSVRGYWVHFTYGRGNAAPGGFK